MDTIKISNLVSKIEKTEEKYGTTIAAYTIAAMIVYLIIAQ